jgi:hypothetical protein
MNQRSFCGLGLFVILFAFGCSDSGGGGGTGGSSSTGGSGNSGAPSCKLGMDTTRASTSVVDACCLLCVKEDPCKSTTTLDDCAGPTGYRKCDSLAELTGACAAATKALLDCSRLQEPDVCAQTPVCDDEATAAGQACN